jgi:hypothetical protein
MIEPTLGWKRGRYSGIWREVSFCIEGEDLVYRRASPRQELRSHRKTRTIALSWIAGAIEDGAGGSSRVFQRGPQWPFSVLLNERGRDSVGVRVLHFGCASKAATRSWVDDVSQACAARWSVADSSAGDRNLSTPTPSVGSSARMRSSSSREMSRRSTATSFRRSAPASTDEFSVAIECGDGTIGLQVGPNNVVTDVLSSGPAAGIILPGDQVLALDRQMLGGRRLQDVLRHATAAQTRTFRVRRQTTSQGQWSQWL